MSRMVMVLKVTSVRPAGRDHQMSVGNFTSITDENGSDFSDEVLLEAMLNSVEPPPPGGTPWRVEKFTAVPVEDGDGA